MTLSSRERPLFQKMTHSFTQFVLSHASDNTTSQNIVRDGCMGHSPHLKFGGTVPPVPPRSPPMHMGIRHFLRNISHPDNDGEQRSPTKNKIDATWCGRRRSLMSHRLLVSKAYQQRTYVIKICMFNNVFSRLSGFKLGIKFIMRTGFQ